MSIFDRPANYDQRFYGESPHRRVEAISPANPSHNHELGSSQTDVMSRSSSQSEQQKEIDPGVATLKKVCAMCNQYVEGARISCSKCPVSQLRRRVNNAMVQAAAAEAEMWRITQELEREATQKGLKVDISG